MLPAFGTDGHLLLIAGSTDLWWPAVERFLESLRLPTSLVVRFPPPTPLPAPRVNEACSAFFRDYVAAPTDAKAFAINPEGRCGFNLTARSLDEAKEEAMKLCSARWSGCKLYAAGQELVKSSK